jgi:hypothetical protein
LNTFKAAAGPECIGKTGGFDGSASVTLASYVSATCQGAEGLTVGSWMRGSPES